MDIALEEIPVSGWAEKFESFVKWRRDCSYKPRLCDIGEFTIIGTQFSDDFAAMMREFAANNIFARPVTANAKSPSKQSLMTKLR